MTDLTETRIVTVERIPIPETADAPDAGIFLEMVRIANAVCLEDAGHD